MWTREIKERRRRGVAVTYLGVVREVGVEDVLDIGGVDGEVDTGGEEGEGNSAALIREEGVAPVVEAVEVLRRLVVAAHQRPTPWPRPSV